MSTSEPAPISYDVLWQNIISTLAPLASLRISSLRIKHITGGQVIVGGFGDVEQAKLRTLFGPEPVVALKKLRPSGDREQRIRVLASLARELDVWSKLKHPNILTLEGFYFDESSLSTAWIATLWQKNGNLKRYLEKSNPTLNIRLKLALDTARGLAYLHSLSPPVCHGDIKAENTLIDDQGNARLCDFGLAKVLEDVPSGLTTTRAACCTIRYAAPELAANNRPSHTLGSDIWAWGCLLLVIMTDLLPYHSELGDMSLLRAIDSRPPADVLKLDLPVVLKLILDSCWRNEPEARPPMWRCVESLYDQALARRSPFLHVLDYPRVDDPQDLTVAGAQWKALWLLDDVSEVLERFHSTGDIRDLRKAAEIYRGAALMWPDGYPHIAQATTSFALSETAADDDGVLDQAINLLTQALALFPRDVKVNPRIVYHLSICLHYRYLQRSTASDLNPAIIHSWRVLGLLPSTHPFRQITLDMLSLCIKAQWGGDLADLQRAILHAREASCLQVDYPYRHASILLHLSGALASKYVSQGEPSDLDDAFRHARHALTLVPRSHYIYPEILHTVAHISYLRYGQTGVLEELEQAIQYAVEEHTLLPTGHPRQPVSLYGHSQYLMARYEAKGEMADLDRAITEGQEALRLLPNRHSQHPYLLYQLGYALHARFLAKKELSDLNQAIEYERISMEHLPADNVDRPILLNHLAWALEHRYQEARNASDLDDAIQIGKEALAVSNIDQQGRTIALANLASCLSIRYEARGDPFDLEEATRYRGDIQALPTARPQGRPSLLNRFMAALRGIGGETE